MKAGFFKEDQMNKQKDITEKKTVEINVHELADKLSKSIIQREYSDRFEGGLFVDEKHKRYKDEVVQLYWKLYLYYLDLIGMCEINLIEEEISKDLKTKTSKWKLCCFFNKG